MEYPMHIRIFKIIKWLMMHVCELDICDRRNINVNATIACNM